MNLVVECATELDKLKVCFTVPKAGLQRAHRLSTLFLVGQKFDPGFSFLPGLSGTGENVLWRVFRYCLEQ